jgi:hypothetical protein
MQFLESANLGKYSMFKIKFAYGYLQFFKFTKDKTKPY